MLLKNLKDKKIILASKSPRRQELLKGLNIDFEIRIKEVDENYPDYLKGCEVARYISDLKANAFKGSIAQNELIITSDTIVLLDDEILEKPSSRINAIDMLSVLSGRNHEVVTAVTLTTIDHRTTFHDITKVFFNELTREEIEFYIDEFEPFDKAGSYGVQEFIGYIAIKRLEGCYYNVMGLPLQKLYKELKRI